MLDLLEEAARGELIVSFTLAALLASWCHFDGLVRGQSVSSIGLMLIFVAAPIGVPIYCLWSRGLRGFVTILGLALALVVPAVLALFVTMPMVAP